MGILDWFRGKKPTESVRRDTAAAPETLNHDSSSPQTSSPEEDRKMALARELGASQAQIESALTWNKLDQLIEGRQHLAREERLRLALASGSVIGRRPKAIPPPGQPAPAQRVQAPPPTVGPNIPRWSWHQI